MKTPTKYPDLRPLYERKARARRAFARLSFAEKLVVLEKLRSEGSQLRTMPRRRNPVPPRGADR